jgi:hypothetical protein
LGGVHGFSPFSLGVSSGGDTPLSAGEKSSFRAEETGGKAWCHFSNIYNDIDIL